MFPIPIVSNALLNSTTAGDIVSGTGQNNGNYRDKDKRISDNFKLKVENLLPSSSNSNSVNSASERQVNSRDGVFAAEILPADSMSRAFSTKELLRQSTEGRIYIKRSSDGYLRANHKTTSSWLRSVKLSSDIYSYNALLQLNQEKMIQLRICKEIAEEDEVIYWFSEEMIALMAIPFLTPNNIRGNNCYTCNVCNISFETPNPLKIHLALSCAQQSIDILWIRLHCELNQSSTQSAPLENFRTNPENAAKSPLISHHMNYRQSAFTPIRTSSSYYNSPIPTIVPHVSTVASVSAAAQIETIVSNMGTSKQGHLCIYCGKVYSRKYGLKIHIRTHTGFKPLKCKFCLRPFGDPSNLNKHVRLHTQAGTPIFKCHLCNKILARRRDLQRHMQTRHCDNQGFFGTEKTTSSDDD